MTAAPIPAPSIESRSREDARVARWLLVAAIAGVVLATPMFLAHFRSALAQSPVPTLSVRGLMGVELVKVALFSWVATALGRRTATAAQIDAPAVRALVRGDGAGARRAIREALPIGFVLGVLSLVTSVVICAPLEGKSIHDYVTRDTGFGTPLARATGVFYGYGITLWFRWGALAVASRCVSRVTRLGPARAFPIASALAAVTFGLFAMVSIWGPHAREPGAWRYALEAMAGHGIPGFITALAVRKRGFESAVMADAVGVLLGIVVRGVAMAAGSDHLSHLSLAS